MPSRYGRWSSNCRTTCASERTSARASTPMLGQLRCRWTTSSAIGARRRTSASLTMSSTCKWSSRRGRRSTTTRLETHRRCSAPGGKYSLPRSRLCRGFDLLHGGHRARRSTLLCKLCHFLPARPSRMPRCDRPTTCTRDPTHPLTSHACRHPHCLRLYRLRLPRLLPLFVITNVLATLR